VDVLEFKQQGQLLVDQTLLNQEESYLYDAGAERGFLACIMQNPQLITDAQFQVTRGMIHIESHRYIYEIMLWLARRLSTTQHPLSFDETTVATAAYYAGQRYIESFHHKKGLETWREIKAFADRCSVDRFPQYIATIRDRATRVRMFRLGRQLQESSLDMASNPQVDSVASRYEAELSRLSFDGVDDEARMTKLSQYVDPLLEKAYMNQQFPHLQLFHLRYPRFPLWMDIMGGGFRRNSLTILAARTKVGKSTLLANMAMDFALSDIPVLFLDTEMSGEEMASRGLSNIANINEHDLLRGHFLNAGEAEAYHRVVQSTYALRDKPFYYARIAGKPVEYGISLMRQFRNQYVGTETIRYNGQTKLMTKPCAVFYDWLKLPSGMSLSQNAQEYQLLGHLCSMIKDAAKTLNLPVIAGAQQNRGGVGKDEEDHFENAESYIAGSDRLAMFCSTLCVLRNPSLKLADKIEEQFGNAREGKTDSQAWKFNQILQIILQRQGRECRYGLPYYIDRGFARYEEVGDPAATGFLRDLARKRKATSIAAKSNSSTVTNMGVPTQLPVTSPGAAS